MAIVNVFSIYILRKLLSSTFVISPIMIAMVWLTISIRHISLIVSNDIAITTFFRFILCTFPDIAGTILPTCSLIATIFVLHKMQSDKELLAIMTSGGGISQFYRPIFAFFAFISFIMFMANTSLAPYAHKSFVNLHERIRNQVSMSAVKQGVFNVIGDSVIYIAKKTENTIENVFISYISKNGKSISNIVTAKSGRYSLDNENLYITLDKGYRQELNESNSMISMLAFDNFTYNVTQFVKKYVQKTSKIYNRTQSELLEMARQAKSLKLKNKFLAEFHGRIVMSLTPFINAAIALLFILTIGMKSRKPANSIRVFLCGAILQIILMTLVNASSKYHGLIYANYFIIIAIVLTLIITTLRKKIV